MGKPRYQLPEGTDLTTLGDELRRAYTRPKKNPQRLDFFNMFDYLVQHAPKEQQVAWLIFELEFIEQKYKRMSPEEKQGYVYNTGSQVYTKLHKILGEIKTEERLIQLNQLRQYIENELPWEAVQYKTWPKITDLVRDVNNTIWEIVNVKEKARINKLLHTMPDLEVLKNNINKIYSSYHSATTGRYLKNPKRESALAFIDFISTTCNEIYGEVYRNRTRQENEKDAAYMQSYSAHRGMILFTLLQIKDEYYSYWPILTPYRSKLFRKCLSAVGHDSFDNITLDEKIDWLRALSKHLDDVRRIHSRTNTYEALIAEWKKRKLPDIDSLKREIEDKITHLEKEKNQSSFMVRQAKAATSAAGSYFFQRAAIGYVTEYALVPTVTATVASMAGGPVVALLTGVAGTFIANRIGRMVSEKLIPTAVGNLCVTLLERIGTLMGEAAAAAAFSLLSVSTHGVQRLLGYYKEHINDNFEEEWILTLLDLPNETLSAKDKQKIRKICGLAEPQPALLSGKMPKTSTFWPVALVDNYDGKQSVALPATKAIKNLY